MLMKERLLEAFERKENDVNSFVWKGKKSKSGQSEVKMMDCTPEELRSFYKHCESMLNSTDRKNPGRNVVYNQIQNQKDRCTTELFLRWLNSERNISKYAFLNSLFCSIYLFVYIFLALLCFLNYCRFIIYVFLDYSFPNLFLLPIILSSQGPYTCHNWARDSQWCPKVPNITSAVKLQHCLFPMLRAHVLLRW